jgi:signal transduction histidine kinase
MGFLSGGLHSEIREQTYRYTNTLFNLGLCITCLAATHVAYLFPQAGFNKERKLVSYFIVCICIVYLSAITWFHFIRNQEGSSSFTYGKFVNPLAGLFSLVVNIWTLIVFIRKSFYFKKQNSSYRIPARLLAFCNGFILVISCLFIYPGTSSPIVLPVYIYGVWILIQAQALIFIIYSAFPVRLKTKLVGFSFASVMTILSITSMIIVPFTTNSDDPANLAQRLIDQQTLIKLMLIIIGSATFILWIFPIILRASLSEPLENLMVGIRRADQGDLSVQVPHGMLDEIGIVTVNFNKMVKSLELSKEELTEYANTLEQQVAERTEELSQSLHELKSTQSQLIHTEKMASLGELTAGIAHEIQNPLNFVNNFSELNTELLKEMKDEMDKGNIEDAKAIANDLIDNEQKINHHGRRADAIVKGMLQHSRSSSGVKESTDINALTEEYLRLAYHGLRAKDKSFNAILKTDYDENIGNVHIVPQDIGRVILNLITNAFYVVNEKTLTTVLDPAYRQAGRTVVKYEPTVSVSTKRKVKTIEIKVADNGKGIPQKILDKIFQPFFTTKPTGEGTGLGLSLSYDIVKAHGGELKVQTKEGEGSEFIIQLPVV